MSATYFSWTFPLDPDATVPAANEINDLMRRVSDNYVCEFIASRGALHGLVGVLRNAQTHGQVIAHVRVLHH